ncbi:hypothetical protein [Ulvibacter litoralis]|uniref:Curlin associated repeat-containing protein n=1 Tax=Ulvibacter litoralis TaxID=227084 RepID=A0A1G7GNY8_9FLAO|nr:hypothetical protein [Ulvibacter litoralis]GHC55574.1 hypothetical protein GCM10008083_19710 [Ulvibacter litoralis]SDE89850.1 hypothetical protein SAMN05421855_103252 [Ulvibacter litoralis]
MNYKIIPYLFLFFCVSFGFAQTTTEIDDLKGTGQLDQYTKMMSQVDARPVVAPGNSVFVEQIGTNKAIISVTSSQSKVEVFQKGNNNAVDLNYNTSEISSLVIQEGDNNVATDYVHNSQEPSNTVITQYGDNLNVQKFGSNSITNGLQINMTGVNKTIIVNSF